MSKGVNKWIGIGNLCADPEVRYTQSGAAVTNFTLACDDSYKDKSTGEKVSKTEFVRIVCFGKLAEIAGQYLHKGRQTYAEGKLQTRKWQDKDGADRYTTEIVASELQMLGGGDSPKPASTGASDYAAASGGRRPEPEPATEFDDDIPFN